MASWRVWDKKPCPLNKIGQVRKCLSRQLVLRNRGHNDCVLFRTRIDILRDFGIREMPYANYRVVVDLFLLACLCKKNGVFANETYRISGVDGIKW